MVLSAPPLPTRSPSPKVVTRAEFLCLADNGFLHDGHYELVQGEIIYKMQNNPHTLVVMLFTEWMLAVWGSRHIRSQAPIDVSPEDNPTSLPEPDAVALSLPMQRGNLAMPVPREIELLIEVSDATLAYDKTTKMGLYTRAGIREYWVADVVGETITGHRNPVAGAYADVNQYGVADTIASLAKPGAPVRVGDFFR